MRGIRFTCDVPDGGRCWKDTHLLKLGVFDHCFPGKIGMTDIDGAVERNGHLLILETKLPDQDVERGQVIMFENITRGTDRVVAIVVWTRKPDFSDGELKWQRWWKGKAKTPNPEPIKFEQLCDGFRRWCDWADGHRHPRRGGADGRPRRR